VLLRRVAEMKKCKFSLEDHADHSTFGPCKGNHESGLVLPTEYHGTQGLGMCSVGLLTIPVKKRAIVGFSVIWRSRTERKRQAGYGGGCAKSGGICFGLADELEQVR
jgi:hypothetical protein